MNFLFFLFNIIMKGLSFFAFIIFEIVIFYVLASELNSQGLEGLATFLSFVFVIWIIIDIILKIFVGGAKSIIRYIFKF